MTQPAYRETPNAIKAANRLGVQTFAGFIGGIVGFALSEFFGNPATTSATSESQLRVITGLWFGLAIFGIGGAIIAGNAFLDRRIPQPQNIAIAIPSLAVGGFIAGYIAQTVYASMLTDPSVVRIARAIGWLIAGALGGLAVGTSFRSFKRLQNGLLGGGAGGLIGGLLFDSLGQDTTARALGITLISSLMGLLIGLIDTARTNMWLEVRSGEMRGRQFLVMEARTVIGSARNAGIFLPGDRAISEHHIIISLNASLANFTCAGNQTVLLNGVMVTQGQLGNGDVLRIGNTEIQVGFKKAGFQSSSPAYGPSTSTSPQLPPRPTATQAAQHDVWQSAPQSVVRPISPATPPPAAARPRLPTKPQT